MHPGILGGVAEGKTKRVDRVLMGVIKLEEWPGRARSIVLRVLDAWHRAGSRRGIGRARCVASGGLEAWHRAGSRRGPGHLPSGAPSHKESHGNLASRKSLERQIKPERILDAMSINFVQ